MFRPEMTIIIESGIVLYIYIYIYISYIYAFCNNKQGTMRRDLYINTPHTNI